MKTFLAAVAMAFVLPCGAAEPTVHFSKKEISIDKVKIKVEIAESPDQHSHGLMFRKSLSDNEGMLFIFPEEEPRGFWMRNTFVALSIGFFDAKKKLIDIQDMAPVKSEMETNPPVYNSAGPAKYALEVAQGWFARKKVKIGDTLHLE
jgi:uncharacterized membrane protein (UPF0127 family)